MTFDLADIDIKNPPVLRVAYETKDRVRAVSESQKDVLLQALRSSFRGTEVFLESESKDASETQPLLKVKCIFCGHASDASLVVAKSVRKEWTDKSRSELKLKFEVSSSSNSHQTSWTVEVSLARKGFYIAATRDVNAGDIADETNIGTVTCFADECPRSESLYDTNAEGELASAALKGMRFESSFRKGTPYSRLRLKDVELVKTGDVVTVTYEGTGDFLITTKGRALSNGKRGASVKIELRPPTLNERHSSPAKIIEATVLKRGEVEYVR